jgi:7-carboxy-7-deazaguanine synthase
LNTRVTEIFYSLSGEGISQGVPTVFVRFAGCSLRCGKTANKKLWCDTEYSLSPNVGEILDIDSILQKINSFHSYPSQIILTGGEPLEGLNKPISIELSKKIYELRLDGRFQRVRIETNGKEDIREIPFAVFSLDYKLPGSGMEEYMFRENFQYLLDRKNPLDEIKFVVRDKEDFNKAIYIVSKWNLGNICLLFSPVQNELEPALLAEWIKETNLPNSRLSIQLHKFLWGNQRGV